MQENRIKKKVIRVLRHGKVITESVPLSKKDSHRWEESLQLVIPGVSLSKAILVERQKGR